MTDLISFESLVTRPGFEGATEEDTEGLIADASAMVRLEVTPYLDEVDEEDCPPVVTAVLVAMIRRGYRNPMSATQESLGDYGYSIGSSGLGGIYATARERRLIRRACGFSAATVLSAEPTTGYSATGILDRHWGEL